MDTLAGDQTVLHGKGLQSRKKSRTQVSGLPDPEQEYFCDGMTEEIIADLSKVGALRVISRSSAMTFKGTKKKAREVAEEVTVQYVLEGNTR